MSGLRSKAAYAALTVYKRTLSPVLYAFGARCRHEPTCSVYAATCVARHGVWAGGWMGLARVCRCRPGGSSGWDPAPDERPAGHPLMPWRYGDWSTHERPYPQGGEGMRVLEPAREQDRETNP